MSPFEVMNEKICRTSISWDNLVKRVILWPKMLKEME